MLIADECDWIVRWNGCKDGPGSAYLIAIPERGRRPENDLPYRGPYNMPLARTDAPSDTRRALARVSAGNAPLVRWPRCLGRRGERIRPAAAPL